MTDLERRALLGDAEAQRECTEKGIVLACPKCGAKSEKIEYSVDSLFICRECGISQSSSFYTYDGALADWNTRTAPPIGRCRECASACNPGENIVTCEIFERDMMPDDFCSQFEPKGGEENGTAPD